jgi:hypothetical protein
LSGRSQEPLVRRRHYQIGIGPRRRTHEPPVEQVSTFAKKAIPVHKAPKFKRVIHTLLLVLVLITLVGHAGLTVSRSDTMPNDGFRMPGQTNKLPKSGFALEIDGRLKAEFSTKEGAEHGAIELKRRFPMLQIRIYDAAAQLRHDLPVSPFVRS